MESGDGRFAGEPTVRTADPPVGTGTSKKRMPARRKATGIHNRPDRANAPARKSADVDVVSHPKTDVTIANRRES
jgi:hypothetical protein